jgi:hypothetical protein
VSKVIADIATKIVEKAPLWIKFPSTEEEFEQQKPTGRYRTNFHVQSGLWTVHMFHPVRIPPVHRDEYVNRKGFSRLRRTCNEQQSRNVYRCGQGQCMVVGCGEIQKLTEKSEKILLMQYCWGVGGEGNGLAPWLMTAFRDPVAQEQRSYNKLHCRERNN